MASSVYNKKYKGIYPDKFLECFAETEEEAQRKMKQLLIESIQADDEPIITWEEGEAVEQCVHPTAAGGSAKSNNSESGGG